MNLPVLMKAAKKKLNKVPIAIKLEGGRAVKPLMAWPLVQELFLQLPTLFAYL